MHSCWQNLIKMHKKNHCSNARERTAYRFTRKRYFMHKCTTIGLMLSLCHGSSMWSADISSINRIRQTVRNRPTKSTSHSWQNLTTENEKNMPTILMYWMSNLRQNKRLHIKRIKCANAEWRTTINFIFSITKKLKKINKTYWIVKFISWFTWLIRIRFSIILLFAQLLSLFVYWTKLKPKSGEGIMCNDRTCRTGGC